jgi:hypothetical protein
MFKAGFKIDGVYKSDAHKEIASTGKRASEWVMPHLFQHHVALEQLISELVGEKGTYGSA